MKVNKIYFSIVTGLLITGCITPVNSAGNNTQTLQTNSNDKVDVAAKEASVEDADYLNELEKNVIIELNKVRKDPESYAKNQVKKYRGYYQGNNIVKPGEITIMTNEGVAAVDECYDTLIATEPMDELIPSSGLTKAAKDLVALQSSTSDTGHSASDGSDPFQRMDRYGRWSGRAAENIDYGYNEAEQIVLALLVDDGVSSRGHRRNILGRDLKYIGVASGTHKKYGYMFVMDFAGGYTEK